MLYGDFTKKLLCAFAIICAATFAFAEINLKRIFSDNMVLQRNAEIEIRGTSKPNAKVELKFAGKTSSAKADKNGEWSMKFQSADANAKPQTAVFLENGKPSLEVKNILVGDVWLISGQSNMEWTVKKSAEAKDAIARAKNNPNIRFFQQNNFAETPQDDFYPKTEWKLSTPETVGAFSAVGYMFAEQISKDQNVPVGLIASYVGGSRMAAWIPEEKFEGVKYLEKVLEKFKKEKASYDYEEALKKWDERVAKNNAEIENAKKSGKTPPKKLSSWLKPNKKSPWHMMTSPSMLYNARIHNLKNFPIRGVLWYQGEADDNGEMLDNFEPQLETLINSWRELFKNPKLPFIFVQLPSMDVVKHRNKNSDWARVRWAQQNVWKKMGDVGMVVCPDTGEINDVHPPIKTDVAKRMANIALKTVYGKKDISILPPQFENIKLKSGTVEISLVSDSKKIIEDGSPRGFEFEVDGKWVPAEAKLQGKKVFLKPAKTEDGAEIKGKIEAVRYLWFSWAKPHCWLKTQEGVPASTFYQQLK